MKNQLDILPISIGSLHIYPITWQHFQGQVDNSMPWSAHIYWRIDYKITDLQRKKLTVTVEIKPNSWVRQEKKGDHLLNHQQGHYLIGNLCALEFMRRVDSQKSTISGKFEDFVHQTFSRTLKEFIELQKKYDNETQHRLNLKKQDQWDKYIKNNLLYFQQIYDKKKGKFVKLKRRMCKGSKK